LGKTRPPFSGACFFWLKSDVIVNRRNKNEAYMEPHSQACGTACYPHTGDILSKEHSPTAKPVVLCVEGEKYAAVIHPVKYFGSSTRKVVLIEGFKGSRGQGFK
jgi:hypothetical protein